MANGHDKNPETLRKACNEAFKANRKSCSDAVWYVIKQYKADQKLMQANALVDHLEKTPKEWQEVQLKELSGLASAGELVVGGRKEAVGSGHVIVVYPGPEKTKGGYYYTDKKTKKKVKCDEKGVYARAMSTSSADAPWPGALSNGDKTVWDPWGRDDRFKAVRFWKYIGTTENKTEQKKTTKTSSSKTPQVITKDAARAISFFPDVCWTQIGPSSVPIPYIIVGYTSDSVNVCQQVTFNGKPVLLCKQSYISKVFGDEAGSNGGIKSGTVSGEVVPKEGSTIFTVNGNEIVCHGDKCTMNGGNTFGEFNSLNMSPGCKVDANGTPNADTNPPTEKKQSNTSSDQNQSQAGETNQGSSPTGNHGGSNNGGQGSAAASQEQPKQDVPYEYKRDNRRDPFEPLMKENNQSVAKTALP